MLSLLTNNQKKEIQKEYYLRLVFVITCWLISFGAIVFFFLLPFYYLSIMRSEIVNNELEKAKEQNAKRDYTNLTNTVRSAKDVIDALKPVLGDKSIHEEFIAIINAKSPLITINNISWSKESGGGKFNVSGKAKTRESLQTFRNSLAGLKEFVTVDLPVSSYSKVTDLAFNLSITYKP